MLQRNFNRDRLIDECIVSLDKLFGAEAECEAFLRRLQRLIASDQTIPEIIHLEDDKLHYESESFIPLEPDPLKAGLFFIVGNPAPSSVARRTMYAYEGSGQRQHRFWRVLHSTGILRFSHLDPNSYSPQEKMRRLFAGEYNSPLNVHIIPFFSLASPTGGQWSGVAGLQRLYGRRFGNIISAELSALRRLLDSTTQQGDCVVVLQKDAYQALKPPDSPSYDMTELLRQPIRSYYRVPKIDLICLPPTRLLYSRVTQKALRDLACVGQ